MTQRTYFLQDNHCDKTTQTTWIQPNFLTQIIKTRSYPYSSWLLDFAKWKLVI